MKDLYLNSVQGTWSICAGASFADEFYHTLARLSLFCKIDTSNKDMYCNLELNAHLLQLSFLGVTFFYQELALNKPTSYMEVA